MIGEPNLIKPNNVFVFFSLTTSLSSLPGAWSGLKLATFSSIALNV